MAGTGVVWPADAVSGAPSYTGRMLRNTQAPFLAGATAARPLGAFSGVRPGTPNVVSATSTTYTVTPFAGIIDLEAAAISGPYAFAFNANVTGTVTAASGSIARKDIVYVQINDGAEGDGTVGTPNIKIDYLAGTVASTAPAAPARSFVIAEINVPISGGGSPTVTWVAPYAASAGGFVAFNTKAQLDATPGHNGFLHADVINDPSAVLNGGYSWTGSAWAMTLGDTGWIPLTLTGSWIPFGGTAYASPCYRRVNGRVKYSGLMKNGSISAGVTFANVPAGFRPGPNFQPMFACGGASYAMVEVTTAGALKITAATSSTYIALDSIDYIAES